MITVLNTRDFVHIPEYSSYNSNYYRNVKTGQILYERSDDDCGHDYWWCTEEDMVNYTDNHGEYIGTCYMYDFDIPTQVARQTGDATEYEYEFDSEFYG